MKKALYSFAMAIIMVAAGSMISSCNSSAKTADENAAEEQTEEVAECPTCILDTPMFAGIELSDEQKEQLKALVPPCAKPCAKEEGACCGKEECDKAACDKPCEKACDKAECDKPCEQACEGQPCPDVEAAKAKFFEEVKAILTPEQFAQFEANVANCQKCHHQEEAACCQDAEGNK